jgi:F0F1-type ATP synthase membrane subunit c/vacuolar-type H+-ATPase subunit K
MISRDKKKYAVGGAALLVSAGMLGALGTSASGAAFVSNAAAEPTATKAHLTPLNNGAAHGTARVTVDGRQINVSLDARRLLKGMPHAQHIHFGAKARNECPSVRDDDNTDHRLSTAEGIPAYGPVRVSLTTRGDTSPKSTLAVDRYPTADDHQVHYDRDGIHVSRKVARAIRHGNAVVVIHGIDYNGNGKYDFRGAGRSELDPSLPAEATDPVTCGVLHLVPSSDDTGDDTSPLPLP